MEASRRSQSRTKDSRNGSDNILELGVAPEANYQAAANRGQKLILIIIVGRIIDVDPN